MNPFTNTETKRQTTSPDLGQSAKSPEGPGRDGNKPLMQNRQANELPSPTGNESGDTFPKCPHCLTAFTSNGLRQHHCVANQHMKITRQEWWVAVDKARVAAGLPEMIYGYDVVYTTSVGKTKDFHFAGTEAAARRAAKLKSLWKETVSVTGYTYAGYVRAYGIPGSKM